MRYYVKRLNEAWMKPDPGALEGLANKSCKSCSNFVAAAKELQAKQYRYDGYPFTLGDSLALPESTVDSNRTQYLLTQESRNIRDSSGRVKDSLPRKTVFMQVTTNWQSGAWRVMELEIVEPS